MSARMAEAVVARGGRDVTIVNRTAARGQALADRVGARAVDFSQLRTALSSADTLFVGIAAREMLIDADVVLSARGSEPSSLTVVDVGMPRSVDALVGKIAGVDLVDMETLKAYVERRLVDRHEAIVAARRVVADETQRYASWASARDVAPLIATLHSRAEAVRVAEMDKISARLAELEPRTREAIENATKAIVAKLLHDPTVALKAATGASGNAAVVDALRSAFLLTEETSER